MKDWVVGGRKGHDQHAAGGETAPNPIGRRGGQAVLAIEDHVVGLELRQLLSGGGEGFGAAEPAGAAQQFGHHARFAGQVQISAGDELSGHLVGDGGNRADAGLQPGNHRQLGVEIIFRRPGRRPAHRRRADEQHPASRNR